MKFSVCLNRFENNHRSAIADELVGILHYIYDLILPVAFLTGGFLTPVGVWLPGCLSVTEHCLWKRNLTKM